MSQWSRFRLGKGNWEEEDRKEGCRGRQSALEAPLSISHYALTTQGYLSLVPGELPPVCSLCSQCFEDTMVLLMQHLVPHKG